jgi:hypothetical protein
MTPSTLCIARLSLDRTNRFALAQACLRVWCFALLIVRFGLLWFKSSCQRAGNRYFPLKVRWRRPTRASTRRDAGCRARRPSRLDHRETHGVTPLATRSRRCTISHGKRRAALPRRA